MTRVWDVNNTPFRVCHSVEAPGTATDDGKGGALKTLVQFPTNFPIFQAKTRA